MIFLSNNVNFASYLRTHKYTQCALLLLELTLISPYAMTSENTVFFLAGADLESKYSHYGYRRGSHAAA